MTYSVVARDPETGRFGVAVQSHYFAVGAMVPWVDAGVGAVATQAFAERSYGPLGLERMRTGETAAEALAALVTADTGAAVRQVGMVDASGRSAAHTGASCIAHAGHRTGPGWSVQANMMRKHTVPDSMAEAFTGSSGDLLERLLTTLDAAEAQGGDVRGQQAAALLVSELPDGSGATIRLQVEDHERPLVELRRLVNMQRGYEVLDATFARLQAGDVTDMVPSLERALLLAPTSDEIRFRLAVALALFGDARGRPMLDEMFAKNAGWRDLIPRMIATGTLPEMPGLAELSDGSAP